MPPAQRQTSGMVDQSNSPKDVKYERCSGKIKVRLGTIKVVQ